MVSITAIRKMSIHFGIRFAYIISEKIYGGKLDDWVNYSITWQFF